MLQMLLASRLRSGCLGAVGGGVCWGCHHCRAVRVPVLHAFAQEWVGFVVVLQGICKSWRRSKLAASACCCAGVVALVLAAV